MRPRVVARITDYEKDDMGNMGLTTWRDQRANAAHHLEFEKVTSCHVILINILNFSLVSWSLAFYSKMPSKIWKNLEQAIFCRAKN